jgi:DNA-binding LacI/PurR family transcriptional regulator
MLKLTVEHYPFVFVDRYLKGIRANSVVTDNLEITRKAVDYLLEKGCRHIVFVSPGNKNSVTDDRLSGFTQALSSYGLPVGSDNLCMLPQELTEPEEKFEWIDGYARKYPAADAYFCVNQEMSSYIKRISDQRGALNCGLFSFDFAESANFNCVIQDVPAIAKACIEVLERAMNGSKEIINRIVPAKLVLTANASRHLDA